MKNYRKARYNFVYIAVAIAEKQLMCNGWLIDFAITAHNLQVNVKCEWRTMCTVFDLYEDQNTLCRFATSDCAAHVLTRLSLAFYSWKCIFNKDLVGATVYHTSVIIKSINFKGIRLIISTFPYCLLLLFLIIHFADNKVQLYRD